MPRSPERQSVPPSAADDRTTERRLVPSAALASMAADSTRDVAQEDFLFHLYRGSELLQENRVLEAKEELEFALTMQPSDPKGQDLLGAVYFRLGLYPRAIQIYESLEQPFPNDASIKINLALCYLKTGQPEPARRVLQDAVRINPEHKRAWGYLGLALQKLGEVEQAQIAFEKGGHAMMAKRVNERRQRATIPAPSETPEGIDEGVRSVAATAFSELDAGELRFALAEPEPPRPPDGPWHTLELGDAAKSPRGRTLPPTSAHESATVAPAPAAPSSLAISTRLVPPPIEAPPPQAMIAGRGRAAAPPLLVLGPQQQLALHPTGTLLVRTTEAQAFAGRLDALRVVAGAATTRVIHRRTRDADTHEVLGGIGSPLVRIAGPAQLVFGARPSYELSLLALDDDLAFVREDLVLGFELRLAYENGRLVLDPGGDGARPGEGAPVVQLRGSGVLVLELAGKVASIPCTPEHPLLVRREWIVGWLGRLVPRAAPAGESPSGQRGLIAFSGEGTVLVCAS